MKIHYLETYDFRKLENYCKTKCINIVIEHHNEKDKDKLDYYRGLYKGYLYGKKIAEALIKRNKRILNHELYNHFKHHRASNTTFYGETQAIYDVMNFISCRFSK